MFSPPSECSSDRFGSGWTRVDASARTGSRRRRRRDQRRVGTPPGQHLLHRQARCARPGVCAARCTSSGSCAACRAARPERRRDPTGRDHARAADPGARAASPPTREAQAQAQADTQAQAGKGGGRGPRRRRSKATRPGRGRAQEGRHPRAYRQVWRTPVRLRAGPVRTQRVFPGRSAAGRISAQSERASRCVVAAWYERTLEVLPHRLRARRQQHARSDHERAPRLDLRRAARLRSPTACRC